MDGWETILSFWGLGLFSGGRLLLVPRRVSISKHVCLGAIGFIDLGHKPLPLAATVGHVQPMGSWDQDVNSKHAFL